MEKKVFWIKRRFYKKRITLNRKTRQGKGRINFHLVTL